MKMPFLEFLALIKVLKMLYGRNVAEKVFANHFEKFYNLDSVSILEKESSN